MNVVHYQDMDANDAFMLMEDSPLFPNEDPAFAGFQPDAEWTFPWGKPRFGVSYQTRLTEREGPSAFDMSVADEGKTTTGRWVSLRIQPLSNVAVITAHVRAGTIEGVTANGQPLVLGSRGHVPSAGEMISLTQGGLFGREVILTFSLSGTEPVEVIVSSQMSGVAGDGAVLAEARPANAAQVHLGDHRIQVQRIEM
jgi:hypothetical protein